MNAPAWSAKTDALLSEAGGMEPFAPFDTDLQPTKAFGSYPSPIPPGTPVAPVPALAGIGSPLAPSPHHFPWSRHKVAVRREADQDALIAALVGALAQEARTIAVVGAKGGVGTTTVTLLAALLLAEVPGARPLVVELAPDGGAVA